MAHPALDRSLLDYYLCLLQCHDRHHAISTPVRLIGSSAVRLIRCKGSLCKCREVEAESSFQERDLLEDLRRYACGLPRARQSRSYLQSVDLARALRRAWKNQLHPPPQDGPPAGSDATTCDELAEPEVGRARCPGKAGRSTGNGCSSQSC